MESMKGKPKSHLQDSQDSGGEHTRPKHRVRIYGAKHVQTSGKVGPTR